MWDSKTFCIPEAKGLSMDAMYRNISVNCPLLNQARDNFITAKTSLKWNKVGEELVCFHNIFLYYIYMYINPYFFCKMSTIDPAFNQFASNAV